LSILLPFISLSTPIVISLRLLSKILVDIKGILLWLHMHISEIKLHIAHLINVYTGTLMLIQLNSEIFAWTISTGIEADIYSTTRSTATLVHLGLFVVAIIFVIISIAV
jgi:hypothetical protein